MLLGTQFLERVPVVYVYLHLAVTVSTSDSSVSVKFVSYHHAEYLEPSDKILTDTYKCSILQNINKSKHISWSRALRIYTLCSILMFMFVIISFLFMGL